MSPLGFSTKEVVLKSFLEEGPSEIHTTADLNWLYQSKE